MTTDMSCKNKHKRRQRVRDKNAERKVYGLDYIEVSPDQKTLTVYFLGSAPKDIKKENVRIDGGRRIRNIQVTGVELHHESKEERDDYMEVKVDQPGDFSTYTLSMVMTTDAQGHSVEVPFTGFDDRYGQLDFSFKVDCHNDLDCLPVDTCPPPAFDEPEINYLAKDYASFRQLILDRLALIMPAWKETHVPDLGIALTEILAYVGDYLSYYQDAVATEAYLDTARQRISVRRHVHLVDYIMHEGCNARAWVIVKTSDDVINPPLNPKEFYFITGYNNALQVSSTVLRERDLRNIPAGSFDVFEPLVPPTTPAHQTPHKKHHHHQAQTPAQPAPAIQLYKAHNLIEFYTWGEEDCCLPRGATSATLRDHWEPQQDQPVQSKQQKQQAHGEPGEDEPEDEPSPPAPQPERKRRLHLQVGDVLIFEEVLGPKTGNPADTDHKHRCAVRVTNVTPIIDELYDRPVVDIAWAVEDALPFPLCLSAIGQAPKCKLIENISVARGNVFLVDHGLTGTEDIPGSVPAQAAVPQCEDEGCGDEASKVPGRFRPQLQNAPLTFSQPLPVGNTPAIRLLIQDPRQAVPQVLDMVSTPDPTSHAAPQHWHVRRDLLESSAQDYDFVVEMDNDSYAHLRFGDGELGHAPEVGSTFSATYRVGNGPTGNVGAGAISHIVFRDDATSVPDTVTLESRNPLPAVGAIAPEPLEEVKLFAPHAFRSDLQRAITADDYAQLAERNPKVQRAAATLRWNGSWYEVLVAIDPLGSEEADPALLRAITRYLRQYQRIGHDLLVVPANYVSLDIEMNVCVLPHYLRGHVKAALLDLFSNRVLPGGKLGFFHPDNLTFGVSIAASKLVAAAQAVTGVQSVSVTRLQRLFEGPKHELPNGILPIGPLEIARLDNDPSFPENGKLTLVMGGGR